MDILTEFSAVKRQLFDKLYSARLNPEQRRAVFTVNGPLLVLAGAGSGKTTVLVNRIVFLIKYGNAYFDDTLPEGINPDAVNALRSATALQPEDLEGILSDLASEPVSPWSVLAITFTNKAAREIKDRLERAFSDKSVAESIWAGTFHSVCVRILRKYGDRLGYREAFSIYDTDDSKRLITQCMEELEIDEKRLAPKAVAGAISMAKDELVSAEDYSISSDPRSRDIKRIYELYQKKLMQNNAVDFDDIIMKTVELLESDTEVREYYQRKFKYVLVDEYQDTNYAQFVLTKLLSDGTRNIMVVGDDDQSIYRFRGATVENILNFDKLYPDATVIKLEQNYRSTGNILAAANAVINNNDNRHEKKLWSKKGAGEKITVRESADQNDEGRYIVSKIVSEVAAGRRYSDFAVLYRVNALGRSLQSAFSKSGIPYRVIGDMRFYDRKEIKDMIAYLSVVASTGDNLRLKRIINEPKRKIGAATVEAIEAIGNSMGLSMYTVMERVDEYPVLARSADRLREFVSVIEGIRENEKMPSAIIGELFERTGYREMLVAEGFEGETKIENINELISAAVEYERRMEELEEEPTLFGFLEEISLVSDVDKYDDTADAVVLMTVHSAKGLEFPVVFLAGMEDGIFPSEQNRMDKAELAEERRLAYVAITRAKERLFITYAKNRMMYGRTMYGTLSSFVRCELPDELIYRDMPRGYSRDGYSASRSAYRTDSAPRSGYTELRRAPEISTAKRSGAASFGVERLPVGARVVHATFGTGRIVSARDMGGDVLYEVSFDNGQTKKLMATFAKLKRL
ncbi:MAG: UvrD-helicase domain-containing protein [Clostridia bacterium]|nr:UvrD-helicase domain-containing protein [Clostridia bacterium]